MIRPSSLKYIEICSDFEQPEQTEVHAVTEAGSRLHEAMETDNLDHIEEDELWMYERASQARSDLMTDVFGDVEPTVQRELETNCCQLVCRNGRSLCSRRQNRTVDRL